MTESQVKMYLQELEEIAPELPTGFLSVLVSAAKLVARKNASYGDTWRRRGWFGNLVRLVSKSDRLEWMLYREVELEPSEGGETVEESALDMINLIVFFLLNRFEGNRWGR